MTTKTKTAAPATTPASTPVAEVTSTLLRDLRPADRAVALMALAEAIKAEADSAKAEALALADLTGARSFRTPMGTLSVVQKDAAPKINQSKLLDHVKATNPEWIESVEQVKPWAAKVLTDRLVIIGEHVYDSADFGDDGDYTTVDGDVFLTNGEPVTPVEYATAQEAPSPYVSWPTSAEKKAAQAAAIRFVTGESTQLAHRMIEAGA